MLTLAAAASTAAALPKPLPKDTVLHTRISKPKPSLSKSASLGLTVRGGGSAGAVDTLCVRLRHTHPTPGTTTLSRRSLRSRT